MSTPNNSQIFRASKTTFTLLALPVIPTQRYAEVIDAMRFLCAIDTKYAYEVISEPAVVNKSTEDLVTGHSPTERSEVTLVYAFPFLPVKTNAQLCVPPRCLCCRRLLAGLCPNTWRRLKSSSDSISCDGRVIPYSTFAR